MDPALWELLRAEPGADDRVVEAIIRFARPDVEIPDVRIVSRFGTIATCRIRAWDIIPVRARPEVASLKAARGLSPGFEPAVDPTGWAAPAQARTRPTDVRRSPELTLTGAGVVVASVDWGVDFDSAAFRWPADPAAADGDPGAGGTRLLSFWDQRDQAVGPRPDPYGYGAVHDREQIDHALQDPRPYERLGYHPGIADPMGRGTHGTHVLDIAAGNGRAGGPVGIAPDADLIFVHLADRHTGGLASFGDSVRLLEAVDFISRTAGAQPCVINISAGRTCGPKDDTTLVERALDELLANTPGRFVVNSAGNYFGWRTHSCGGIAPGEARALTFVIDPADITLNELEIWYDGADEFAVRIDPPGYAGGRPVLLGERSDLLVEGRTVGRVYHRKHDPNNGDNHIVAYIDPIGRAGNWTVTLEARRVTSGRFHAWIERDDTCRGCQARFARDDSSPVTTIGTIATSRLPLVVGAYDGHDPARPVAPFSSSGPSRDLRPKPDLVAPGVDVLAARSAPIVASRNPGLLVRKSGTSMATPHVTGAVALCFEAAGCRLDARQIRSLVLDSCDPVPDPDTPYRLGHGYLNIPRLLADLQRSLTAPAATPSPKEPPMNTDDSIMLLAAAPATAYREYLYRPRSQLARWIDDRFDVVARPGQRIEHALQAGDVLLQVTLGQLSSGRCLVLEAHDPELEASPRTLSPGQLVLRPRGRVQMSEPLLDDVPFGEDANGAPASDYLDGKLWTFTATTLALPVTVFCPKAALSHADVEVLLFVHGLLKSCNSRKDHEPVPADLVTDPPFRFGSIVSRSGRPMVLVVPLLTWSKDVGKGLWGEEDHRTWHPLGKPEHVNGLIGEVLAEVGRVRNSPVPSVNDLVIAGHSRAYDALEPLAFSRHDAAMKEGALAHLSQVWAFDTTYNADIDVDRWTNWLKLNPKLRVHLFYNDAKKSPTAPVGDHFFESRRERLDVVQVKDEHCDIPARWLPALLKALPVPARGGEAEDEAESVGKTQTPAETLLSGDDIPAPAVQPDAGELTTRIVRCIGIWETNRGGDDPVLKESALDTVAGVHASMATIEQATMPYAITVLKGNKALRDKADPPLTMKELVAAEACVTSVGTLLSSVADASAHSVTPDDFIAANSTLIAATHLGKDDVKTMFRAVTLKGSLDKARADMKAAGQTAAEKAVAENKTKKEQESAEAAARQNALKASLAAIPAQDRLGLGEGSLRAYISKPGNWGENRAGWQRKAVAGMPDRIGARIEAVAVSDNGRALAIPRIRSRVDAQLAKAPTPGTEDIVKIVAQENNPHEADYGLHVWQTYHRLYP